MTIKDRFKNPSFPHVYSLWNFKLNFIWYNNPKCCSSTIKSLIEFDGGQWTKAKRWDPRQTYGYKSFGFVRNPYSRLFSAYRMLKISKTSFIDDNNIKQFPSENFDQFINQIYEGNYWNDHLEPQINFLPITLKNVRQLEFIGKTENFVDDWMRMQEFLDHKFVDHKDQIPNLQPKSLSNILKLKTNESVYNSLKKRMCTETVQKIQALYKEDFINFGYDLSDFAGFEIT